MKELDPSFRPTLKKDIDPSEILAKKAAARAAAAGGNKP